jgi:hypothetical protein
LKRVYSFTTEAPLKGEIERFERNTDEETRAIRTDMHKLFVPDVARSTQYALPRNLVRCDTSAGNLTVKLPAPSADNAGLPFPIVKTSASNTLTVQPLTGSINGASSLALTNIGLHLIYCDGATYWAET